MDAIEFLTEHHRHIEDLFDRMDDLDQEDDKAERFRHIASALEVHGTVEREHFYPVLRENNVEPEADEGERVHDQADERVAELLTIDPGDETFDRKLGELWSLIDAHFRSEENVLFPRLRAALNGDALESLGGDMQATVEALPERRPADFVAPDEAPPVP